MGTERETVPTVQRHLPVLVHQDPTHHVRAVRRRDWPLRDPHG